MVLFKVNRRVRESSAFLNSFQFGYVIFDEDDVTSASRIVSSTMSLDEIRPLAPAIRLLLDPSPFLL